MRDVWANKKVTVRPYFRKGLLVHVVHLWFHREAKRNGAHHGRVSYVDVAHGEDRFQSVRWYCYDSVADIDEIAGHSYIICGPLAYGRSTFMFESLPT